MRFLRIAEVIFLHARLIEQSGGSMGLRSMAALDSSLAQPRQSFGGEDLYSSLAAKASALGFSLIQNHPFIDGNKRVGHASMEMFLQINGYDLVADVNDAERTILAVASGQMSRPDFEAWVTGHARPQASHDG